MKTRHEIQKFEISKINLKKSKNKSKISQICKCISNIYIWTGILDILMGFGFYPIWTQTRTHLIFSSDRWSIADRVIWYIRIWSELKISGRIRINNSGLDNMLRAKTSVDRAKLGTLLTCLIKWLNAVKYSF